MTHEPAEAVDLAARLVSFRPQLVAFVRDVAGAPLLRFETPDDLVQGIHGKALAARDAFRWAGEEPFKSWLFTIARRHLADRRDHWFALKRGRGAVLRLTRGGGRGDVARLPLDPADTATGPATFAFRREQLVLATRAIDLLLPRDREIVRWSADGVDVHEQAARLGLEYDAAVKARTRAIERLRKAFRIVGGAALPEA